MSTSLEILLQIHVWHYTKAVMTGIDLFLLESSNISQSGLTPAWSLLINLSLGIKFRPQFY